MPAKPGSAPSRSNPQVPSSTDRHPVRADNRPAAQAECMTRLPPVLSELDLPLPELLAARLDGELFALDASFTPIDEIESIQHRIRAVHTGRPDRLIAEQHSAAWIWGAMPFPPSHHQLCVTLGARVQHRATAPIREVVIDDHEIVSVEGLLVTAPLRTAIDLARFSPAFGQLEETIVAFLMRHHGFGTADCLGELERRRNLPGKRRAVQRLSPLAAR